ncbi:CYTH and CHAD domain-containing protein [Corynebacterium halotolerans]|uniref:CHAD domain-containing protein n=1 Tax=Corynebacterium halotolerans YIM 70093 = DSM 44683 TaxID=1121362 RepID=M1MZ85_9CORY|nr:CYTH and CHAD domain-containing protein [Corynebacterium halotolerans]AGF72989.1 hypothetical protein A605_09935 [Corynebacterium halotolerans YIM 70093 = DSM 44683]
MSTRTFLEIEAKFAVAEQATVPDLTHVTGVSAIAVTRTHHLSAIYYDTEDLRLTRSRITLRRRSGGKDDGWHLKLPGTSARLEVQAPLGEPVDGQFQVPEDLQEQVRSLVRTAPLVPIAQVDNERSESVLAAEDGSPVAEFCDDHVTAWSLLPGGDQTSWREWEIELAGELPGTEAGGALMQSATPLLIGAGARVSSSPSKLVAALGESLAAAPLPLFQVEADLEEDSPAAAVIEALKLNRDKLLEYDPKVRRDEWDSVHQMRVATRELRSHLETFDGVLGGAELKHIESELKLLAQVLGAARDAEVVEERFLSLLDSEDSDVLDETTREHLREDMGTEYRKAHRRVVATLNSGRYLELLDAIDRLLAHPPVLGAGGEVIEDAPGEETGVGAGVSGDEVSATPTEAPEVAAGETGGDEVSATPTEAPEVAAGEPLVGDEDADEPEAEPEEEPAPVEDVEEILSRHLDEAYAKLMKRHRRAVRHRDNRELTLHQREEYFHDMRKSAKKLRYAAEAVGAATDLKTKRLYKACKQMQSILGDFQDSVTSRDRLVKMAEQARRRGEDTFGYGLLYQRERYIGLDALDDYSDAVEKITAAYERLTRKRK